MVRAPALAEQREQRWRIASPSAFRVRGDVGPEVRVKRDGEMKEGNDERNKRETERTSARKTAHLGDVHPNFQSDRKLGLIFGKIEIAPQLLPRDGHTRKMGQDRVRW